MYLFLEGTLAKFGGKRAEDPKVRIFAEIHAEITKIVENSKRSDGITQSSIVNEALQQWLRSRTHGPIKPLERLSAAERTILEWWNNPPAGFDTQLRDFVKARLREPRPE